MDKRNKRTAVADAASSTVNTETNVSKVSLSNGSGASGRMSPADFKQWLTDEYYRNMAMNFATMRKRRSVPDQAGLEGAPMEAPGERDDGAAFERLRSMEQNLLQEALQLMQVEVILKFREYLDQLATNRECKQFFKWPLRSAPITFDICRALSLTS